MSVIRYKDFYRIVAQTFADFTLEVVTSSEYKNRVNNGTLNASMPEWFRRTTWRNIFKNNGLKEYCNHHKEMGFIDDFNVYTNVRKSGAGIYHYTRVLKIKNDSLIAWNVTAYEDLSLGEAGGHANALRIIERTVDPVLTVYFSDYAYKLVNKDPFGTGIFSIRLSWLMSACIKAFNFDGTIHSGSMGYEFLWTKETNEYYLLKNRMPFVCMEVNMRIVLPGSRNPTANWKLAYEGTPYEPLVTP